MKYVDRYMLGQYDSKQDNKALEGNTSFTEDNNMKNLCPNIKMPAAREEGSSLLSYDSSVTHNRPEDLVDLDFKLDFYTRVQAFVAIGRSLNMLGKTFKLKQKYLTAAWILEREKVRFEMIDDETSTSQLITH